MRRDYLFWGSVFILLGILFFIHSTGTFGDFDVWGLFWPILFILLGCFILFNHLLRLKTEIQHITIPLSDSDRALIQFDHGAGRLNVKAGQDQDELVSGNFGGVEFTQDVIERQMNICLKMPLRWFPVFWLPGITVSNTWNVYLKRDFPLILIINTGANETNLDLSNLKVEKVVLKTGASSTNLQLPNNAGYTALTIDSGVASVDVHIPENVSARIRTDVGLASININRIRFPKRRNEYISDNYDLSENKVEIDISGGISAISVE